MESGSEINEEVVAELEVLLSVELGMLEDAMRFDHEHKQGFEKSAKAIKLIRLMTEKRIAEIFAHDRTKLSHVRDLELTMPRVVQRRIDKIKKELGIL